jgi:hypothetical protein
MKPYRGPPMTLGNAAAAARRRAGAEDRLKMTDGDNLRSVEAGARASLTSSVLWRMRKNSAGGRNSFGGRQAVKQRAVQGQIAFCSQWPSAWSVRSTSIQSRDLDGRPAAIGRQRRPVRPLQQQALPGLPPEIVIDGERRTNNVDQSVWRREIARMADRDRSGVSRRSALQAAIGVLTIGAAGRALSQQAPQKIDQKLAQYQTSPKNGQSCYKCAHFEPPASCKLVAGTISPAGWCMLFSPKPA